MITIKGFLIHSLNKAISHIVSHVFGFWEKIGTPIKKHTQTQGKHANYTQNGAGSRQPGSSNPGP